MNVEQAYDFFDLTPDCEDQDIELRFRSLAKKYHPDMHRNSSEDVQEKNETLFRQLIDAEEVILKDRALAEKRKWEKALHQRAPKPKAKQREPKCPYPHEDPEVLAGWLKTQLKKQQEQRLQNIIESDFRAMIRNLIMTLLCALPGYFAHMWLFYLPAAYFGFATLLIYLDWQDTRYRLNEMQNPQ